MPSQLASKARLRTRSGCSTCRRRKKKCDEVKPVCGRCSIASVDCNWPELAPDGRQKHLTATPLSRNPSPESFGGDAPKFYPHAADSWFVPNVTDPSLDDFEFQGFMDLMIDWAPEMTATVPEVGEDAWLFDYWYEKWLPSLLHKHSSPRYWDFSYIKSMALKHPPLMETALACAAMSHYFKPSSDPNWMSKMRDKALTHHTASIAALRDEMSTGRLDGTEDWFLATITGLTLFDNRDPKAVPAKSGTHVMAVMQLFKAREASKYDHGTSAAHSDERHLAFERIHYEYLLYHSTIFMLYDPVFDTLVGNTVWTMIESYFANSPLPFDSRPENWPILGMHYKLFRLIIAISRLGRRIPLNAEDLRISSTLWEDLLQWSTGVNIEGDASVGTLYTLAAKILLQRILFRQTGETALQQANEVDTRSCLQLVDRFEIGSHFSRSLVWPISVLYDNMAEPKDKLLVREKMRVVLEKTDGGGPLSVTDERVDMFLSGPSTICTS